MAVRLAVALSSLLLLASCGDSGAATDIAPQDPELLETGADLYAAHCAECHGADVRGSDQGPSLLSEVYVPGHHPDEAFQLAVLRGSRAHHWPFGDMPPVQGLSDRDVDSIIAFIREQQRIHGFEPYPP